MANYTAADVKKLRELTGAGMMDCKKALDEAEGDFDKAVEILRVKGQKGVAKREGRTAENGAVVSLIADDNAAGVLVELKCETDFVAKGDKFIAVADAIAAHVAATSPADSTRCSPPRSSPARPSRRTSTRPTPPSARRSSWTASRSSPAASSASYLHRTSPDLPPQVGVLVELDKAERRGRQGRRAAHRRVRAEVPLPARTSPPSVSRTSAASPRRPRARRASPSRRCRRSSRVASTASSRRTPCSTSRSRKDNKKSVQKVLDEAGVTLKRFARFRVGA